jgi:hypothetical protein
VAKEIDPYYEWLGIPPKDQPPNHYRLLGIELFESNRNVIDTAANRQMSFIKEYQAGADSELSQKLLNQLSAARICLLSPAVQAAYDEQLRAKLKAHAGPIPDTEMSFNSRWRNDSDAPWLASHGFVPAGEQGSAIPISATTGPDTRLASESLEAPRSAVIERWLGILCQSNATLRVMVVAAGVTAVVLVVVLTFVLFSLFRPKPEFPKDAVAERPREQPATIETPESTVADSVTAPASTTFSPLPPPDLEPSRTSELPPAPLELPVLTLVIEPPVELPSPLPVPIPEETLEQAEERLKTAAERASAPAEHRAVAQESLSIVNRAIVDARAELGKRVAERALAAARKSESDDLVKQATLLWSELEQPLTDEVQEKARQRLLREPAP